MLFNSIDFLFFFPFVVLIYFLIPKRGRIFWLLIASYYFYMSWNAKYAVLIGASTMLTYVGGGNTGLVIRTWTKDGCRVKESRCVDLPFGQPGFAGGI